MNFISDFKFYKLCRLQQSTHTKGKKALVLR